MFTTFTHCYK